MLEKLPPLEAPPSVMKRPKFRVSWLKNLDPPNYDTGSKPITVTSPHIFQGMLFQGDVQGMMRAHNLETGSVIWAHRESAPHTAAPAVFHEKLYYGTADGRLTCRDYLTGKLLFAVDLGAGVESTPNYHQGRLLLHLRNHRTMAVDAETGKILWAYTQSVPYTTTLQSFSRPVALGSLVFVGKADGHLLALSLEEGLLQWQTKLSNAQKFVDVDSGPKIFEGHIVASSPLGPLTVLDPKTGTIIRKIPMAPGPGQSYLEMPQREGHSSTLMVGMSSGELVRYDGNFKELQRSKIAKESISALNMWRGNIVVATLGQTIYLVDPLSLKIVESFSLGGPYANVMGEFAVGDDALGVISSRNRLYVFR